MSFHLQAQSELDALRGLLRLVLDEGGNTGNYRESLSCLLSVPFNLEGWNRYCTFRAMFLDIGGSIAEQGWARASRVYTDPKDRPTKPSYLSRLVAYPDRPRRARRTEPGEIGTLNQVNKLVTDLAKKPGLSNLSFVFLRPADLHDQFRPGYVPCPISGDLKMRSGHLHLNVMFRTIDVLAVAYADLYYLRKLQLRILQMARDLSTDRRLETAEPGHLNLFLCRAYITRRLKRGSKEGFRVSVSGLSVAQDLIEGIDRTEF